jgi:hypothetical protein
VQGGKVKGIAYRFSESCGLSSIKPPEYSAWGKKNAGHWRPAKEEVLGIEPVKMVANSLPIASNESISYFHPLITIG